MLNIVKQNWVIFLWKTIIYYLLQGLLIRTYVFVIHFLVSAYIHYSTLTFWVNCHLILEIREQELKYLKGRKFLDALCVYFWATTPVLISILTFTTYILMGNKLTAATVFTTIALLNMLIGPLNAFPWVLNGMTEAWVSLKRIQNLLDVRTMHI